MGTRVGTAEAIKAAMEAAGMGTVMEGADMVAAMAAAVHTDTDLGARSAVLMLMRPLMLSLKMMSRTKYYKRFSKRNLCKISLLK